MKIKHNHLVILLFLNCYYAYSQTTSIQFELNGKNSNSAIREGAKTNNPFHRFIGEWTLKNDTWIQNWGNDTDTLSIAGHHTTTSQINTDNSLLQIIDGPEPNGHILWTYNPNTKEIDHLSSFGTIRIGRGTGIIDNQGNLELRVSFEGETSGSYRIYTYTWLNPNEYLLNSIQYNKNNQPTGLFYRGTFIRLPPKEEDIRKEIETLLAVLDDQKLPKEIQLSAYAEDIIHMAPNHKKITSKNELLAYLEHQAIFGYSKMKHHINHFSQHGTIVLMHGKVTGTYYPKNQQEGIPFETKNIIVFKRENSKLKIAKVIYNSTPIEP